SCRRGAWSSAPTAPACSTPAAARRRASRPRASARAPAGCAASRWSAAPSSSAPTATRSTSTSATSITSPRCGCRAGRAWRAAMWSWSWRRGASPRGRGSSGGASEVRLEQARLAITHVDVEQRLAPGRRVDQPQALPADRQPDVRARRAADLLAAQVDVAPADVALDLDLDRAELGQRVQGGVRLGGLAGAQLDGRAGVLGAGEREPELDLAERVEVAEIERGLAERAAAQAHRRAGRIAVDVQARARRHQRRAIHDPLAGRERDVVVDHRLVA